MHVLRQSRAELGPAWVPQWQRYRKRQDVAIGIDFVEG
jgi:hypothetical protein